MFDLAFAASFQIGDLDFSLRQPCLETRFQPGFQIVICLGKGSISLTVGSRIRLCLR